MGALTGNKAPNNFEGLGDVIAIPVGTGVHIFNGSCVCINNTGFAVPGADHANYVFQGLALEEVDNSAGADGALFVHVRRDDYFEIDFHNTAIQGDVGDQAYVKYDGTAERYNDATHYVAMGEIVKFVSATRVQIDPKRRIVVAKKSLIS